MGKLPWVLVLPFLRILVCFLFPVLLTPLLLFSLSYPPIPVQQLIQLKDVPNLFIQMSSYNSFPPTPERVSCGVGWSSGTHPDSFPQAADAPLPRFSTHDVPSSVHSTPTSPLLVIHPPPTSVLCTSPCPHTYWARQNTQRRREDGLRLLLSLSI